MKKNILLLILISFVSVSGLLAQSYWGFHFLGTSPTGKLQQMGFGNGGGLGFEYVSSPVFKTAEKPATIRWMGSMDLQCVGYSKKIENVPMPTPDNDKGYVYLENTTFGFSFGPRMQFNTGTRFTPYTDINASLRIYGTQRHNTLYDESKTNTLEETDNSLYTAVRPQIFFSGGFMLRISKITSLDLRLSYATGPGAKFANLESAWKDENNQIRYTMENPSVASFLTTRLGLVFKIGQCGCN